MLITDTDVEVLKTSDNDFKGLFFQTNPMKNTFEAFPEFLALDGTYKLVDINVTVFLFLVEDSSCESEIVAVAVLTNEDKISVEWMIETFKKKNPASISTACIMTDKDMNERCVLRQYFPNANLLLCIFHTKRTFNREISCKKLGITESERENCLEVLDNMVNARSEASFEEQFQTLCQLLRKKLWNII